MLSDIIIYPAALGSLVAKANVYMGPSPLPSGEVERKKAINRSHDHRVEIPIQLCAEIW